MNVMMKKTALGVIVAMIGAGCVLLNPDEERNEVVQGFLRYVADSSSTFCIERVSISTGNAIKVSDVCVDADGVLQAYRIEGRKIINYRWLDNRFGIPKDTVTEDGKKAFSAKECVMREAFWELPNRLEQTTQSVTPLKSSLTVVITDMGWFFGDPFSLPRYIPWDYWGARQWRGTPEETPVAIEAFRQAMEQAVSAPECARKYRSYLRAVPLFTEADAEADRGSPVIDPKKARYHVHCALQHPYLLIPVPEWVSPFPAVPRYKPGDKFKVREGGNYFLIETFKGK